MLLQVNEWFTFRHLLVNPKERRIVIVESILTPSKFRNTLAKVLFTHYEVSTLVNPNCMFAKRSQYSRMNTSFVMDYNVGIFIYQIVKIHLWNATFGTSFRCLLFCSLLVILYPCSHWIFRQRSFLTAATQKHLCYPYPFFKTLNAKI